MKDFWLDYPIGSLIILIVVIALVLIAITNIVQDYRQNPFQYPCIRQSFNLSGKRQPSYAECIDAWIIRMDYPRQNINTMYNNMLKQWDSDCEAIIENAFLWQSHKRKIYESMREEVTNKDYRIFLFEYYRQQTRYQQRNYQRESYKVNNVEYRMSMTLRQVLEIDDELREINYETTRKKYEETNQRKLMTPELRQRIKDRDNYTCQLCGKEMFDEVGLQIDHIVPISKGGKSVESNLRVLCDKCNSRKGAKHTLDFDDIFDF